MLAFTFPGQGSQRPGMGRPWADHESWELVEEASIHAERDVAGLLLDADADQLKDTRNAQLCTFVTSLMVLDAVERLGIEPSFCAGHSLGEYTALTASGALAFDDGVRLVCERAEAMHEAGIDNPGTMAAVLGLERLAVAETIEGIEGVWVANDNAPGQVVISGRREAVAAATQALGEAGARRVVELNVAGAFHSPLMEPARSAFEDLLRSAEFDDARIPVLQNTDPTPETSASRIRDRLVGQITAPVRWTEVMNTLTSSGPCVGVEAGPGTVLAGLAKRIDDLTVVSVESMELEHIVEEVL
jgi:[acyl-carrier-protein] S-malonyltransferase